MYAHSYVGRYEVTGLWAVIENARYQGLPPPALTETAEEETTMEALLREAVTSEEHLMLQMIDKLVDESWRFDTGKGLRGELRKMFLACGLSKRAYYRAFHALKEMRKPQ
jgi:hypothetical protein